MRWNLHPSTMIASAPGDTIRFLRTPKGILLMILGVFVLLLMPTEGSQAFRNLVAAVAASILVDLAFVRWLSGEWRFPSGAILTGLIVAMVLRVQEPWIVAAVVGSIAVISKHVIRTIWSNIFNPAAVALVVSSFVFATGQSWWGALPGLGLVGLALLLVAGIFMADRINKLPLVAIFLACYLGFFTLASFLGDPSRVAEVFRTPDIQALLFFAFFMLDDPPTCPTRYEDQIVFAIIVAAASYAIFNTLGGVYYLPLGLLTGNAWESGRRVVWQRTHRWPTASKSSAKIAPAKDKDSARLTRPDSPWARPR